MIVALVYLILWRSPDLDDKHVSKILQKSWNNLLNTLQQTLSNSTIYITPLIVLISDISEK